MNWVQVKHALSSKPGEEITLKGWVRTRRDSKAGLSFINLHDGTCQDPIQIVAPNDLPNYESEILHLNTGCSIEVDGELVESQGKGQSVEVRASAIRVIGTVEDPDTYPASAKRHSFEYLREVAHLRPRTNTFGAIARVRHALSMSVHRFFDEREFYYVHTPIITANDAEGAGQMFRVSTLDAMNPPLVSSVAQPSVARFSEPGAGADGSKKQSPGSENRATKNLATEDHIDWSQDFFGKEAHLTVSGQLNVETYCCALSRVYTFGPTFRAENSNTSRHLAEFWMIEPEIAFADLADDAQLAEDMLKYVFKDLLDRRADDMEFFDKRIQKGLIDTLTHIVESPFIRLPYTDAVDILQKAGKKFEYQVKWGIDLQSEHERFLTEEHFKQPVILTDYPKDIKAFYMRLNDDEKTVAAMDVLVPGIGEIIGGSQREERLDVLDRRIDEMNLPKDEYWWYRDLRRYGTVPHAGFGLGFERLVQFSTGMANIRDVIPFPRAPKQAEF